MKKLLLASLFVIGASAFAGVEGGPTSVELPVRLKGNLVSASSANLMIEGTTTGMAGNIMDFDFGDIQIPVAGTAKSQLLTGTYKVWIPKADTHIVNGIDETAENKIKIGFTPTGDMKGKPGIAMLTNPDTGDALITGDLKLTTSYKKSDTGIKSVSGFVTAQVEVDAAAPTGTFVWNNEKIYVVVKP